MAPDLPGAPAVAPDPGWQRYLPVGLLAVSVVVATVADPALDRPGSLGLQLGLAAVTAVWVGGYALLRRPPAGVAVAQYVVRTALAFTLCVLNPFYAIFSFVGMVDAFDVFRRRRLAFAAVLVTAVIQGGSQSGGLPPGDAVQAAVFVVLVLVNFGLGVTFTQMHLRMTGARDEQAAAASALARLNADLRQALDANAELHARLVAQARDAGVQDERRRLAREIHDTLAQHLAGIVAQLEAAREDGDPVRLGRALGLAREALADARRSVLDLAPAELDGGSLPDAVRDVVTAWSASSGVPAGAHVSGDPVALHPEVEATVLRVLQESLANVARHAGAQRVDVTLSYVGDDVIADVRDDGVGFDVDGPRRSSAFGLRGMHQRAERLAGELVVESTAGTGTVVSLRLPALVPGVVG